MLSKKEQSLLLNKWQLAKIQWLAQALANLSFGLPLVILVFIYMGYPFSIIKYIAFFYIWVYLFIYVPFFGFFPLFLLRSARKTLNKIYKKEKVEKKEGLRVIEELLNLPVKFAFIVFAVVFLGFVLGVFILWLGLIPELMPRIELIVVLGLVFGFMVGIIQAFLHHVFLENYLVPVLEFLGFFYPEAIGNIKIRKLPIFFKVFFLVLLTTLAAQISLWVLFMARIAVTLPGELKTAFIYVSIVIGLTLVYVFVITVLFTRNFTYPLKKLIFWAEEVTEGKAKEKVSIITNDEVSEMVEYLKQMVEELENSKTTLEIRVGARTKELKELAETREEIIKQRTKELRERIEELERFQKLTVGRELKMIELKEELEKLKKEFEKK